MVMAMYGVFVAKERFKNGRYEIQAGCRLRMVGWVLLYGVALDPLLLPQSHIDKLDIDFGTT